MCPQADTHSAKDPEGDAGGSLSQQDKSWDELAPLSRSRTGADGARAFLRAHGGLDLLEVCVSPTVHSGTACVWMFCAVLCASCTVCVGVARYVHLNA